jgi:hypothetical protein
MDEAFGQNGRVSSVFEQKPGLPVFRHVRNCEDQRSTRSRWSFELPRRIS